MSVKARNTIAGRRAPTASNDSAAERKTRLVAIADRCLDVALAEWQKDARKEDKAVFKLLLTRRAHQRLAPLPRRPGRPRLRLIDEAEHIYRREKRNAKIRWRLIAYEACKQVGIDYDTLSPADQKEKRDQVRDAINKRLKERKSAAKR